MAIIGNSPSTQSFTPAVDYFSGNAVATAFTLSRPVASSAQIQVVIEDVPQNPSSAYTVNGNTITFTSAPPSGTNNIYVYYTSPNNSVVQPGQATVNTAQIANGVTINFGDGSAAAPSIANWEDSNTGIFFPAADTIAFAEGGVERIRIDANGNLGIGTSSPAAKLDVTGAVNSLQARFGNVAGRGLEISTLLVAGVNDGGSVLNARGATSGTMIFQTDATERMRIDSSGNMYVGADTSCNLTDFRSKSLTANGYQKIAGGLIIQWGTTGSIAAGGAISVTFPIAFPSACVLVVTMAVNNPTSTSWQQGVPTKSTTGFSSTNFINVATPFMWFAMGY
jgi:hypothetical protein